MPSIFQTATSSSPSQLAPLFHQSSIQLTGTRTIYRNLPAGQFYFRFIYAKETLTCITNHVLRHRKRSACREKGCPKVSWFHRSRWLPYIKACHLVQWSHSSMNSLRTDVRFFTYIEKPILFSTTSINLCYSKESSELH